MKKFLSLVLALVMTMSLVTVAGAEDFTDDASIDYKEAVEVMTAVGVVNGYADGSFGPDVLLNRGQAAKIICNMILGPTTADALAANEAPFKDVPADHTFAGYIAYCVNEGILSGYADGTFRPAGTLTGYAFWKMLLGALGYDAAIEGYTGSNWAIAVAKRGLNLKLNDGLEGTFVGTKPVTRQEALLYAFNTMKTVMVKYDNKSTISVGDIVISQNSEPTSVGMQEFYKEFFPDLVKVSSQVVSADDYGRPAHAWKYDKKMVGTYTESPIAVYTEKFTKEQLVEDVEAAGYEFVKTGNAYAWVNAASSGNYSASSFAALADSYEFSSVGTVREFYGSKTNDGDYVIDKCVIIETTLDQVTAIVKDKASTKADDRSFTLDTNGAVKFEDEVIANFDEIFAEIEEDDYVLVTLNTDGNVETVEIPEVIEGKVTKVASGKATIDGTVYAVAANGAAAVSTEAQNIWLDPYGNVMKTEAVDSSSDVVYFVDTFVEYDKFDDPTYYVRVVTADGEVVELKTETRFSSDGSKMFTYTIDPDGYAVLELAENAYMIDAGTELKTSSAKVDGEYFADDVVFVYVDGVGSDLKVSVKEGVQALTVVEARYVQDAETEEVVAVFVTGGAGAAAAEDLIFAKDGDADGDKIDDKGVKADAFAFYIKGEAYTEIVSGLGEGLFTYTVDADTGRYTAEAEENSDVATMNDDTIVRDKYVTVGSYEDYVLAADCEIYDLTDNEMTTLAEIDDLVEEGVLTIKIAVAVDTDDKEITTLYVWEA